MTLSRVIVSAIVAAVIMVGVNIIFQEYINLRIQLATQTASVNSAITQINEISDTTFTRSLAELYYRQAKLDVFTEQTLGPKAAKSFKESEDIYIRTCRPTFGERECRREWMKAHVQQLFAIIETKTSKPHLTPV